MGATPIYAFGGDAGSCFYTLFPFIALCRVFWKGIEEFVHRSVFAWRLRRDK